MKMSQVIDIDCLQFFKLMTFFHSSSREFFSWLIGCA